MTDESQHAPEDQMVVSYLPRRVLGHALCRTYEGWECRCGDYITSLRDGRAEARDIYRFHLLDVWMVKRG